MKQKEGQVPRRRTASGPVSTEPNTPGRVLARLKEKLSLSLGIDAGIFRMLVDTWARGKQRGMDDPKPAQKRTNAIVHLGRVEITNGLLFRYFEIIGAEEVEYTIKVKMPDGTIAEATEKMLFNKEEALFIDTTGNKKNEQ